MAGAIAKAVSATARRVIRWRPGGRHKVWAEITESLGGEALRADLVDLIGGAWNLNRPAPNFALEPPGVATVTMTVPAP